MIELKNITKRYGKNENEVFALKDVSLRIDQGEFVAIMGSIRLRKINITTHNWSHGSGNRRGVPAGWS